MCEDLERGRLIVAEEISEVFVGWEDDEEILVAEIEERERERERERVGLIFFFLFPKRI